MWADAAGLSEKNVLIQVFGLAVQQQVQRVSPDVCVFQVQLGSSGKLHPDKMHKLPQLPRFNTKKRLL